MSKKYTFICEDSDNKETMVSFMTDNDSWIGADGPVDNFFNFLKGCGFCFSLEDEMGVMRDSGKFVGSSYEL